MSIRGSPSIVKPNTKKIIRAYYHKTEHIDIVRSKLGLQKVVIQKMSPKNTLVIKEPLLLADNNRRKSSRVKPTPS